MGSTSTKTADIQSAALLEMISPHGNSPSIPKTNDYFKEKTSNGCFQTYHLQKKLKYYLQNFHIPTGKNIVINFKIIIIIIIIIILIIIINIKNLLLANTNQTLQI